MVKVRLLDITTQERTSGFLARVRYESGGEFAYATDTYLNSKHWGQEHEAELSPNPLRPGTKVVLKCLHP